jgi:hypothetical protein
MEPMKFKVPAGTKEIQIEEVNGQIVTSFIPEKTFKNGDFITCRYDGTMSVIILDGDYCGESSPVYHKSFINEKYFEKVGRIGIKHTRTDTPSTDSEKKQLLDAMHDNGFDWDAKKMEVVPYVWTPKIGELYYSPIITGDKPSVEKDVWSP